MPDLVADLLERCRQLEEQFAVSASRIWFRGQADAGWPLLPTALRDSFLNDAKAWVAAHPREGTSDLHGSLGRQPMDRSRSGLIVERVANERFRREAAPLLARPEDRTVVYIEARHAEMPSRLLDWTTRPLIALFFASLSKPDKDGRIFVLSAESRYYHVVRDNLSEASGGFLVKVEVPVTDSSELFSNHLGPLFESVIYAPPLPYYFSSDFEPEGGSSIGGAFPILPTHHLSRVAAQHSCFTFHPPESNEYVPERHLLESFDVPASAKEETLRGLRLLGIDEATVWPDLDGTARAIRSSLGLS